MKQTRYSGLNIDNVDGKNFRCDFFSSQMHSRKIDGRSPKYILTQHIKHFILDDKISKLSQFKQHDQNVATSTFAEYTSIIKEKHVSFCVVIDNKNLFLTSAMTHNPITEALRKNKFNVMFSHFQGPSIPQWDFYIRFIPIYRMAPKELPTMLLE